MIRSATGVRAIALALPFAVAVACGDDAGTAMQGLAIGSPCATDSQCGTDPPFFCDKDHPNGYCKRDCQKDADCPSGSICAHDGITVGECHKSCDGAADCRQSEGYICKPSSSDPVTFASHSYCDVADQTGADMGAPPDATATGG